MPTLDRFQEALALIPSLLSVSDVLCRHTSSLAWSIESLASDHFSRHVIACMSAKYIQRTTSSRSSRQHTLARQLLTAFVAEHCSMANEWSLLLLGHLELGEVWCHVHLEVFVQCTIVSSVHCCFGSAAEDSQAEKKGVAHVFKVRRNTSLLKGLGAQKDTAHNLHLWQCLL